MVSTRGQFFLVSILAITLPSLATAESPRLWGKLSPGPHAVGFKSLWQLDYSRRYNMTFDDKTTYATGKAPRPILINIWYPAKTPVSGKPMSHGEYLQIKSDDPLLTKFATALAHYDHTIIAKEIFAKPPDELADRELLLLRQFLDTPTACIRNPPPGEGKFPLVIYHSGNGSSFEDNSVLCEFLASHGFVVFGSAFQVPDGSSFNVANGETRDFEFLIGYAKQIPNVDWNHIGIIGHSAGAHAALTYRAQPHCAADAIVSLDTTQDYYGVADRRWEPMTTTVTKNRKNMTGPILMVANPHAYFELADSLSSARRTYLTIKDLDHNDFISQGRIARELRFRLQFANASQSPSNAPVADEAKEKAGLEAVKSAYESLCVYVLRFLDAELKGAVASKEFLAHQYRDTKLDRAAPHVEFMPEGQTGPPQYSENSDQPPTPRQLRTFLHEHGSEKTLAVLRRFRKDAPDQPIFHPVFGLALVGELLDQGKTPDAIAFRNFYREFGADCDKMLMGWGKVYTQSGARRDWARDYFKKVLLLDPSNSEAADQLKKLGDAK